MRTQYSVALSVIAGVALGAAAIEVLHAQAKPMAYSIALNTVNDPENIQIAKSKAARDQQPVG
jgi:hypothetical protein